MKIINTAADEVRRQKQKTGTGKKTRYAWLKAPKDLTSKQEEVIEHLNVLKLKLKADQSEVPTLAQCEPLPRGRYPRTYGNKAFAANRFPAAFQCASQEL